MLRSHRLDDITSSDISMQSSLAGELAAQGRKILKFTVGEPDFATPDYIVEAAKKALDEGFTKYADFEGPLSFRQAVCDKYERDNHIKFDPDQVISTIGGTQAAYLVLSSFVDKGDEIIIPDPFYNLYKNIAKVCGATIKEYSLKEENEFQIDLEELSGLITDKTKMIVICSPNNPIGGVLTRENLEGVAEVIGDKDIIICSDEIYERLTYDGTEAVSPAEIPALKEKTIIINGLSKTFAMTGWRIGYIISPKHLFEAMYLHTAFQVGGITSFVLEAGTVALNEEYKYGTIEAMRNELDNRRKFLAGEINSMKHFSCLMPKGAFYIFMNIKKTGMTSDEFTEWLLLNYGIAVVAGRCFGSEGEGFVRISYASSMENCVEAMKILHKADKDLDDIVK